MQLKRFNISLSHELVDRIDRAAELSYMGRSDYIREALLDKLREMPRNQAVKDLEPLTNEQLSQQIQLLRQELARRDLYKDDETRPGYRADNR